MGGAAAAAHGAFERRRVIGPGVVAGKQDALKARTAEMGKIQGQLEKYHMDLAMTETEIMNADDTGDLLRWWNSNASKQRRREVELPPLRTIVEAVAIDPATRSPREVGEGAQAFVRSERIRRGEVPDVRTFSPACPEPVAAFLATALSRDRLARPADAGVLRAHLDHLTATIEP